MVDDGGWLKLGDHERLSGDMACPSYDSWLTMVLVGVKRRNSNLDRASSASLGYDHGHVESW